MQTSHVPALERRSTVHRVDFDGYCELLVSRRKLERVGADRRELLDSESGELYVLDTDSGSVLVLQR